MYIIWWSAFFGKIDAKKEKNIKFSKILSVNIMLNFFLSMLLMLIYIVNKCIKLWRLFNCFRCQAILLLQPHPWSWRGEGFAALHCGRNRGSPAVEPSGYQPKGNQVYSTSNLCQFWFYTEYWFEDCPPMEYIWQ